MCILCFHVKQYLISWTASLSDKIAIISQQTIISQAWARLLSSQQRTGLLIYLTISFLMVRWAVQSDLCCCCCWVASVVSNSVQPHRWQPTRLLRPWDSPGKNTGVVYHFLLQCMKVKSESEVTHSCPTLSNPMDCSLPGCSIQGIFQARVKSDL